MCIAIVSPKGKKPSNEVIEDAFRTNSDGAGIAWIEGGQVHWKKGLDLEGIKTAVAEVKGAFIIHFRIASVGPKVPELTHPFPLTDAVETSLEGSANAVLFQNGTWSSWEDNLRSAFIAKGVKVPPPPWSDARAVAFLAHSYGSNIIYLLNNSSRFAVFDATGRNGKPLLSTFGDWSEHEDLLYSNRGSCVFTPPRQTYVPLHNSGSGTGAGNVSSTGVQNTTSNGAGSPATTDRRARRIGKHVLAPTGFDVWAPFTEMGLPKGGES